jgi:hypothetical protein
MAQMKELAYAMQASIKEGRNPDTGEYNAEVGMRNSLRERHISVHEWDIGKLFRECFGENTYGVLRSGSAEDIADFFESVKREAAGAVSTAAFAAVNKAFAYTAFLEPYSYPEFVFTRLIPTTTLPQGSLKYLEVPGITNIGDETDVVEEGDNYPVAGVTDNIIRTPEVVKKGLKVEVTKEAIFFDRTGQVVQQCRDVGKALALKREKRCISAVVDAGESKANGYYRYRWGKSNTGGFATIATFGDNSGTHSWDNLAASNAFTSFANMNTAWQKAMDMTDPFTGERIYFQPKHLVVGPSLAFNVPQVMAANITTAVGGYPTTGNPTRAEFTNPVNTIVGPLTPVGTSSMMYEDINTAASAATTWYLGDLTAAFGYLEAWAPRVDSMSTGTQVDFDRDIVMQFKVSEMGTYFVREPRAVVRCTA